jgi:biotin transporter BioY
MRALLLGLLLAVMTAVPVFADDDGGSGVLPEPTTTIEAAL